MRAVLAVVVAFWSAVVLGAQPVTTRAVTFPCMQEWKC
jgi:hypothetical protein